jgi:hypothetical protein
MNWYPSSSGFWLSGFSSAERISPTTTAHRAIGFSRAIEHQTAGARLAGDGQKNTHTGQHH